MEALRVAQHSSHENERTHTIVDEYFGHLRWQEEVTDISSGISALMLTYIERLERGSRNPSHCK